MGFRTWWLANRLQSTERKLRKKRFLLKRLRDRLSEAEGDRAALEAERSRITSEIDALATKEKALKDELRAASE